MIAFIGCVKLKNKCSCRAEEMYTSELFKKSLAYAKTRADKIYILSAKYGLLELDDIISPYNDTLNEKNEQFKKIWAYKVYNQCVQKKINFYEQTIFLCGKNYRKYLMRIFKNSSCPLEGLRIGEMLAFYKENL